MLLFNIPQTSPAISLRLSRRTTNPDTLIARLSRRLAWCLLASLGNLRRGVLPVPVPHLGEEQARMEDCQQRRGDQDQRRVQNEE